MNSVYFFLKHEMPEELEVGNLSWILDFDFDIKTVDDTIFENFINQIHHLNSNIKTLDLSCNFLFLLSLDDLKRISENIKPSIKNLNLSLNKLGMMEYEHIKIFLSSLPSSIETLELHHNNLGNLSFEEFKQVIMSIPSTIKQVSLYGNKINYNEEKLQVFLKSFSTQFQLEPIAISSMENAVKPK